MAQDQQINYRVNVDDSGFQAKLSQMRASMDMTMGGMGGAMMGGNPMMMAGLFSPSMSMGSVGGSYMGGLADFGSQIRPVTYTPPAIAMQPHFGMVQIQQSLSQAGLASMGPLGIGMMNPFSSRGSIPNQISFGEYSALSARGFGMQLGDAVAGGAATAGGTLLGIAASGIGSAVMGGMAGGPVGAVLGFIGGVAGATGASQYMGGVTDMAANNRAVQSSLAAGSFRFISGGADLDPLTGRGFSRGARADIARSIQNDELSDNRFGMGERRQILEAGMQMDMFSGTGDVESFKSKFKDLVGNVKTIMSTLHTSLQEGMEVIRGFRDMGVTDSGQINRMVMGSEMSGRMSGRTGMEMMAIGQAGAEIFRGTGVRMGLGFETNQLNTVTIRNGLNQGTLSRETVAQAGGENSLAQQMTASALASFQTPFGRGAMMANFDPSTGALRGDTVSRMMGQDPMQMVSGAASLGIKGMLQLQAHQEEIISKLSPQQMQLFDAATTMSGARVLASQFGLNGEDAFLAYGKMSGKSLQVLQGELSMLKQDPEKLRENLMAANRGMRMQAAGEDFRERFGAKRVWNALSKAFIQPLSDNYTSLSGSVEQAWTDVSIAAQGGNSTAGSELVTPEAVVEGRRALESASASGRTSVVDVRGSWWQNLVGGQSGSALGKAMAQYGTVSGNTISFSGGTGLLFSSEAEAKASARADMSIVGTRDGKVIAISDAEQGMMVDRMRSMSVSADAREAAGKEKLDTSAQLRLRRVIDKSGKNATTADMARAIFGENVTDAQVLGSEKMRATVGHYLGADEYVASGRGRYKSETGTDAIVDSSETEISRQRGLAKDARTELRGILLWNAHADPDLFKDTSSINDVLGAKSDEEAEVLLQNKAKKGTSYDDIKLGVHNLRGLDAKKRALLTDAASRELEAIGRVDSAETLNARARPGEKGTDGTAPKSLLDVQQRATSEMATTIQMLVRAQSEMNDVFRARKWIT